MVEILPQAPADNPAIEELLDRAFGLDRHQRPSYRLRDGVAPLAGLGFVAWHGAKLVGTVRFWPITMGDTATALLLGPLAVDADYRHQAVASSLIENGLAATNGETIIAVGDFAFFGRFNFAPATPRGLAMPGLADADRLLVRGDSDGASGCLTSIPPRIPSGIRRLSRPESRR